MDRFIEFVRSAFFRRIVVVVVICLLIYLCKPILNVLLLTLIFVLLAQRLVSLFEKKLKIPRMLGVFITYLLVIGVIVFVLNNFVGEIATQSSNIINTIIEFYEQNIKGDTLIGSWIQQILGEVDLKSTLSSLPNFAVDSAKNVGAIGLSIFMAFLLSFFFLVDLKHVDAFAKQFVNSRFGWFWQEIAFLGNKFIKTFGIVLETQFVISLINTFITTVALYFLGFSHILALSILIFILGLIPVAGVFISCIPLAIIAYAIGGIQKVIIILLLIVVIHAIEAYLLNPKIMSTRTKLPIFIVFLVLFVAEQFLGAWGLILGIPIFVFLLDLLDISIPNNKSNIVVNENT